MSNNSTALAVRSQPFSGPAAIGAVAGALSYIVVAWMLLKTLLGVPWLGRVLSDDYHINGLTFVAFGMAMGILLSRQRWLRRQQQSFQSDLLVADEQTLVLPEDAQTLRKRLAGMNPEVLRQIPIQLLDAALQRARAHWSATDAAEAVKTRAELMQAQNDAEYALVRYLAWAIPSIGFIGTVLGLGMAIGTLNNSPAEAGGSSMQAAAGYLYTAFDTTLVALVLSLVLMYFLHVVQAADDSLLVRSSDWCLRRFVFRMHGSKEGGAA